MSVQRSFPAKLLLFGEYTVLSGSRALAIPLSTWNGNLQTDAGNVDPDLLALHRYLTLEDLFTPSDRDHLYEDIQKGLRFASNIPQGAGVGSSGALCAALFDRYFRENTPQTDVLRTRQLLSAMESHFHGTSSGMDPLVSLLNVPILREGDGYVAMPPLKHPVGLHAYLIDSGSHRSTSHLVKEYLQASADETFKQECLRPLIQSVDHAISFFITGYVPMLWEHLKLISLIQFKYFRPMIPHPFLHRWVSSLDHPGIAIKLCGAGGGGYFLGFTLEESSLPDVFQNSVRVF